MEKKLIFLDTETTGRDEEDRLCEVAYKVRHQEDSHTQIFKPPLPIKLEAMAIHHITEKVAAKSEVFKGGDMFDHLKGLIADGYIIVAHNAQFDVKMLQKEGLDPKKVICTMKVARHLDNNEDMSCYKMQYIRHFYDIEADVYEHSAEGDIHVLEKIFDIYEDQASLDEMMKITEEPFLLRSLPFGKHKGIPTKDVPFDYLLWLRKQSDLGEDLLYTLNYYIKNRG